MEPTHFESLFPANSREKEIEQILSFIKKGDSCQLISFPGVGRSNLLRLLSYNKAVRVKHLGENTKWFHFVLVSFSEIRKKPLFEATKFLFLNLVDSLRERQMDEEFRKAQEIFKESLSYNDELVLFQGLKRTIDLLAIEKELTIVFLFDRFEDYISAVTTDFFANLRILRNRAKYRFSVVFSTDRQLEDVLEPALFADFYEFIADHVVTLSLYDKLSNNFRISYIEKIVEHQASPELKKDITHLTSGHGKLIRVAIEVLLTSQDLESSKNLTTLLLSHKRVGKTLSEIWNSLSPFEQTYLISDRTTPPPPYLTQVHLIDNGALTIPLLDAYIKQEAQQTAKQPDTITIDSNTQDIKKGDLLLSESLTSAEFRLLRFCLQNPDRILEREEVIQAVWHDAKSTAGVTDQALDQLIFRVRRKIEDDPNNPKHLQTIKGRGFRFTA